MRALALLRAVVAEFNNTDGTILAAAIAYYTLLSIFPLVLGLLALVGFILGDPSRAAELVSDVAAIFPGAQPLIESTVRQVVEGRGTAGFLATVGFLWSASGVFDAISLALDRIWGVTERRGFVKNAATAVGLVLSVGLVFIASLALSTGLRIAANVAIPGTGSTIGSLPLLFPIVGLALPYAVSFGLFAFIYQVVPHRHLIWRQVWPGALVASILFEIGKQLFAWYLSTIAFLSLVYGSIGAVIALVTWSYYAAIVLLVGAYLNAVLTRQRANAARSGRPSEVDRRRDTA